MTDLDQLASRILAFDPERRRAMFRRLADVAAADATPGVQLAAYFVAAPGERAEVAEIFEYLRQRLPDACVPRRFEALDELPRAGNGKIDRRRLARLPSVAATGLGAERRRPPHTPIQELVATLWCELLNRGSVALDDDFFLLGGHSLLAARLMSRLRNLLGVETLIRAIFEKSVLCDFCETVEAERRARRGFVLPPLERAEDAASGPLSFSQERLWFIEQLAGDAGAYNSVSALALTGKLDPAALERAFAAVIARHGALRTAFNTETGRPIQIVREAVEFRLPIEDLLGLSPQAQTGAVAAFARDEGNRPFDLATAPLLRAWLFRLGDDRHALVVTCHHIISDGWSGSILMNELTALYNAFAQGFTPVLATPPYQYLDYARWQRRSVTEEVIARQLVYWRMQLADMAPLLDLPTDFARPAAATFRGRAEPITIPAKLATGLKRLARAEGVTLFMLLLGAFSVLLYRYSGQRDIVVGTDTAGRGHTDLEPLIGLFVNQLVLRNEIDGDQPFRNLMKRIRETTLDAYDHQDTPFARLVETLGLERNLGYNPLYQVSFTLHDAPPGALALTGLRANPIPIDTGIARFDLELNLVEAEGRLEGALIGSDLFADSTVNNLVLQYLRLLEEIVERPDMVIDELNPLTPALRRRLLVDWNRTEVDFPKQSICELIAGHTSATPMALAAVDGAVELSYRDLSTKSAALAAQLRREGVGRGTLVALLAPRGVDFLIAILACLEAGAAYLPLDPHDPSARHRQLISDSRTSFILAEASLRQALESEPSGARALDLGELLARASDAAEDSEAAGPRDLAYVIYTSGSTGAPKGAMVEHGGMLNHLWAKVRDLDVGPGDVIAQTASQCFDISVWQFLCPLVVGGRVRIYDDEVARDPVRLLDFVRRDRVTIWETVPSMLRSLLSVIDDGTAPPPELPALRWLVVTGEALASEVCRHWLRLYPRIPIVNAYGPTECSDDVTHAIFRNSPPDLVRNLPIGRPIANTQLYLLNERAEPAPLGATGQLYIGGVGVGRGYLHSPRRTAEVFLPDPFAATPGRRMYRTGDLARYQPDGVVEFLGRADHQVKLRGFRIELGEIENVLTEHSWVREAVATVHRGEPGGDGLVAYVVLDDTDAGVAPGGRQSQRLSDWRAVFDDMYEHAKSWSDELYAGWSSSYTGAAIPDAEMAHWRQSTVARIRELRPRRALEVGCGLGMLLSDLAPHCEAFCGLDFSQQALNDLRRRLDGETRAAAHVKLLNRRADELAGLPDGPYDTIILNSVAQYFPNLDYLLTVLDGMFENLAHGGRIFLGDLRNLVMTRALHTHVALVQAADDLSLGVLRERVRRAIAEEGELMLHPALFPALRVRYPRIARVEVQLKRGRHLNELTRFRYDVVLSADDACPCDDAFAIDWREAADLELVRAKMAEGQSILVRGVPNARLAEPVAAWRGLDANGAAQTAGELRASIANANEAAVEPEVFWDLENDDYRVAVLWSVAFGGDGCFDVRIEPRAIASAPRGAMPAAEHGAARSMRFWRQFASNPMQEKFSLHIEPQLKKFLAARLPAHMVPRDFVMLTELPLNRNGKLDRKALPAPERRRAEASGYLEPRTPTERAIAAIWTDLLGEAQIGRQDNFFEIGGHSLIAVQALARMRKQFGVELTIRAFFELKTIEALARETDDRIETAGPAKPPGADGLRALGPLPEYDLAFYQLPEWYVHELDPVTPAYNICWNLLLTGDFQPEFFIDACRRFVSRHRVMASTFHTVDGVPVVRVLPELSVLPGGVEDFTDVPDDQFHASVQRLATAISAEAPDFTRGPVFRMRLCRYSGGRFVFLFMVHHIIWDETSTMIMVRELRELYSAGLEGRAALLAPVELTYFDYAQWANARVTSGGLESERNYWLGKLDQPPPPLQLATDRPRAAVQTFRGDELRLDLSPALSARIDTFARDRGATPYILFLAILNAHLHAWSGQRDFVIGSPSANRNDERLKDTIGLFATALPLRCTIRAGMTFAQLLDETREAVIAAFENQAYPSVLAIRDLAPEMDPSRNRLFSIMYGLQNDKTGLLREQRFGRASVTSVRDIVTADAQAAPCDLTYIVDHHLQNLFVRVNYNRDLFERSTIEAKAGELLRLIERVVGEPDLLVEEIGSGGRPNALLEGEPLTFDEAATLPDLVERQAACIPGAIAFRGETPALSYGEFAATVRRWRTAVQDAELQPEARVGLLMRSSPALAAAAMGVMQAGAAFVALGPDAPAERLKQIASDAGLALMLTAEGDATPVAARRIDERDLRGVEDNPPPAAALHPRRLAYVVYTSGSTGRPKGVQIEHRGLVNLLAFTQGRYGLGPADRVLWLTPLGFDASMLEIFWPLSVGASVVVCPEEIRRDPPKLLAFAAAQGVTVLQGVPTLLEAFAISIERGEATAWPGLRLVISGGAVLTRETVARLRDALPARIVNHYGPTEATVDVTCHDCEDAGAAAVSPIGRPIANARVAVLDAQLQLLPRGAAGEIWASSPGLARGYLGDPRQTAQRFLPNPFSDLPGDRIYRTGDVGIVDTLGLLHYRGRIDDQVQIYGNRVEINEVQNQLERHPAVAAAAVLAVADDESRPALAAFIALAPEAGSICVDDRAYWLFTARQRPDVAEQARELHERSWPRFFAGSASLLEYWARLGVEMAEFQVLICDEADRLLAVGNAAPIRWNGTVEDLPRGWDDGLARAFRERDAQTSPDTLFILAAAASGPGLSQAILAAFRNLARAHRLERILVAVRPVAERPDLREPFAHWAVIRRPDEQLNDRWLRAHERAGGRILAVEPRSQFVSGCLAAWEEWIGRRFDRGGEVVDVPGTLQPISVDLENDRASYWDPAVWMEHRPLPADEDSWRPVDETALRSWLAEWLPAYMIPDSMLLRARLPLTESGKVDRAALRRDPELLARRREPALPRTHAQIRLAELWRLVLGLDAVGIEDNFFRLGGNSMKAVRLVAEIRLAFGVELSLRDALQRPTIVGLERLLLSAGSPAPAEVSPSPRQALPRSS